MFVSEISVWVSAAQERYQAAKKLLEASKNDPPNEPYRSKYEAREILSQLAVEIDDRWKSSGILQVRLLSALFNYELGIIGIETEELGIGCDILTTTLEKIREIAEKPECCYLALSILNQLGILWSERGEIEKAHNYLLEAETLYTNFKTNNATGPFVFEDIFVMENASKHDWTAFEKTFTHTLYYLAQVYGHMSESGKSAKYCRQTLKRQRESGEYETNDWAMNCATLSQYFVQDKLYREARHLLSCAAYVLLKYETKVEKEIEENRDAWTDVHQNKASLSCCWIKYSINVLVDSQKSTEDDEEKEDIEQFSRLIEDEEVLKMEQRIPCCVSSYDDAKCLFIFAQNHVSVANSFFTLNEYANNYAEIIQDHGKLYKSLASCDPDLGRQCKMHKRRSDLLEELLNKLNPQFYLSVCRQLQFELGEICHEMIDLKTRINDDCLSVKGATKINYLATKGIGHFTDFIATLRDKNGKLPEVFSDDIVRPALIAHFYIGKYYSKIIENSTNKKLHNLSKTEHYYKFIVKYVENNPEHANTVEKELPVLKEMLELMPEKMLQITGSTLF